MATPALPAATVRPNLADLVACPVCHGSLSTTRAARTEGGRIRFGDLDCSTCGKTVGAVEFGRAMFVDPLPAMGACAASGACADFGYRRIPHTDPSVAARGAAPNGTSLPAEGCTGSLFADGDGWTIEVVTEAADVSLRFLAHGWSGGIEIRCSGGETIHADLYHDGAPTARSVPVCRGRPGQKHIEIRPAASNPQARGRNVFFLGYDACFDDLSLPDVTINRGNHYPATYPWVLDLLPADAVVLDAGCGDRRHRDPRVVGFEYLPYELPHVFGDGHRMPFRSNVFDAVLSQAVLEHMRNPFLAARELARILKPGGVVYAESAFMQPLHAVPFHYFNTTPWGIETLFEEAGIVCSAVEWFGNLSGSVAWYLDSVQGAGLDASDREALARLLQRVDAGVGYESLKAVASGVAYWGTKPGGDDRWSDRLGRADRPTHRY